MWALYVRMNPSVDKVKKLMEQHEGGPVKNDHIAIRTFNHPVSYTHLTLPTT